MKNVLKDAYEEADRIYRECGKALHKEREKYTSGVLNKHNKQKKENR